VKQGARREARRGEARGKAEGRDEQLVEIVREMYNDGDSLTKIARICHLTEERVRQILDLPTIEQ